MTLFIELCHVKPCAVCVPKAQGSSQGPLHDGQLRARKASVSGGDRLAAPPLKMTSSLAYAVLDALRSDDVALDELRALISVEEPSPPDTDAWMTAREAATYLGFASVHPLHKLTAERSIPFAQDGPGCRLFFKRSDLDAWRRNGGALSMPSTRIVRRVR
jgi:excisionase family DNA binding protein